MIRIYELVKQDVELSRHEAVCLGRLKRFEVPSESLLMADKAFDHTRLAFTRKVFEVVCAARTHNILCKIPDSDIGYRKSFSVRVMKSDEGIMLPSEKELASVVWKSIEKPRVDLKNPYTKLYLIGTRDQAFFCREIWHNQERFQDRKPHLRPSAHPTSLHPRLARALVNMLNRKVVMDPFCGTGGILIEAGLMALKTIGYDISNHMLARAERNLSRFGIRSRLCRGDATKIATKAGIVTDLPYGKNSCVHDLDRTYSDFMSNARRLTSRMVVVFPSFVDPEKFLRGWDVEKTFRYYIHSSMSKNIFVLNRSSA